MNVEWLRAKGSIMNKGGITLCLLFIFLLSTSYISQAEDLNPRALAQDTNIKLKLALNNVINPWSPSITNLQTQEKIGKWNWANAPYKEKSLNISVIDDGKPWPPRAFSQDIKSQEESEVGAKSGIGFVGGYVIPLEGKYREELYYGANLSLGISKNATILISGFQFQRNVQGDPEEFSKGKLTTIPIHLSIQARLPLGNHFTPYFLGGVGA